MYEAFISGYHLAEVSHGKPYYVYRIEILESQTGTQYSIERRYSEFSALHRTVCYQNVDKSLNKRAYILTIKNHNHNKN